MNEKESAPFWNGNTYSWHTTCSLNGTVSETKTKKRNIRACISFQCIPDSIDGCKHFTSWNGEQLASKWTTWMFTEMLFICRLNVDYFSITFYARDFCFDLTFSDELIPFNYILYRIIFGDEWKSITLWKRRCLMIHSVINVSFFLLFFSVILPLMLHVCLAKALSKFNFYDKWGYI